MQTYNQIIKLNREFAEAHYQIKTFGNGAAYNIVLHDKEAWFEYPLMWVEDVPATLNNNEFQFNFRVYFIAQVAQLEDQETDLDSTNENEVKSDMIQCAQDLLSFWAQDTTYPELDLIKTGNSFTTITDKFSDRVTGCYIDLRLKQGFTYNKCAIPMSGVTPPPSVVCFPVTVNVNSVPFAEVASGGAFNLNVLFDGTEVGEKVGDDLIVSAEYENGTPVGVNVDGIIQIPNPITCADVIVNINGELWAEVPSGDTENIIVRQSTGSTQVGGIEGAYYRIADSVAVLKDTAGTTISTTDIKAEDSADIVAPDSTITVNGGAFDTVVSGGTLDVEVEYETSLDNPIQSIVGNKILIIDPVVVPTTRLYQKDIYSGATTSYYDGDAYWRKVNNIGVIVQSEVGVMMRLQFGSKHLLEYPNIFDSLWRWTGLSGGYYDPTTGLYYNKLGATVTRVEAFPSLIAVDHLTSDLRDLESPVVRTWTGHIDFGMTRTTEGFTGWYVPTVNEMTSINNTGVQYGWGDQNLPFLLGNGTVKITADTYLGNTSQCIMCYPYNLSWVTPKLNNNRCTFIKPININTDIIIS